MEGRRIRSVSVLFPEGGEAPPPPLEGLCTLLCPRAVPFVKALDRLRLYQNKALALKKGTCPFHIYHERRRPEH